MFTYSGCGNRIRIAFSANSSGDSVLEETFSFCLFSVEEEMMVF
jgi:hypothetical protein